MRIAGWHHGKKEQTPQQQSQEPFETTVPTKPKTLKTNNRINDVKTFSTTTNLKSS
jgi:hypothetical protein